VFNFIFFSHASWEKVSTLLGISLRKQSEQALPVTTQAQYAVAEPCRAYLML
jgi:hypothetical protein